jgi:hypothetical protein
MTQEAIIVRQLTLDEAQVITSKIQSTTEMLWELLFEAHEGKAWEPMGYTSWQAYVHAEFQISRSQSYRLIDQAKVTRAIEEAAVSAAVSPMGDTFHPTVEVTERQVIAIKPHIEEVVAEVRESVASGVEPQQAVHFAIQKYGTPTPKDADALALESGQMVIGNDGNYHSGKTAEEKQEIAKWEARIFALVRATEAIDCIGEQPDFLIAEIPDFMRPRIELTLENAVIWLDRFYELWNEHDD